MIQQDEVPATEKKDVQKAGPDDAVLDEAVEELEEGAMRVVVAKVTVVEELKEGAMRVGVAEVTVVEELEESAMMEGVAELIVVDDSGKDATVVVGCEAGTVIVAGRSHSSSSSS